MMKSTRTLNWRSKQQSWNCKQPRELMFLNGMDHMSLTQKEIIKSAT